MKTIWPWFVTVLLVWLTMTACAPSPSTAAANVSNPVLSSTVQADQYWRDAEATTQAYQMTVEANYRYIEGTAQAATRTIVAQQAAATATTEVQHTRDALYLAMTTDAATAQAIGTATRDAEIKAMGTARADAQATTAAYTATRQAFELKQAQSQANREQFLTVVTAILGITVILFVVGLGGWFFWQLIPTLVNRAGLVRYGQHNNPLLLSAKDGRTVIADPLRMLQAAMQIDGDGNPTMPEISPNDLQMILTGGMMHTLVEQAKHAPGHAPQLPAEFIRERRFGPMADITTTRHTASKQHLPTPVPQPQIESGGEGNAPLLPTSVSWERLQAYRGDGLALGVGSDEIISLNLAQTPHILLSGSSGTGKTRRILRPLIAQAIAQGVHVVLLNESGADFSPFYGHPQATLIRGSVDIYMAFIQAAIGEMERRESILRAARVSEWGRLPAHLQQGSPLLIVIDEVLSLALTMPARQQKAFWALLATYASRARKLGMGSVGALTDPTYRVLGAGLTWREQCTARITFRVAKASVSRAVLDAKGAEMLADNQFLAMLGSPQLVNGVAANPTDDELSTYLAQYPTPFTGKSEWIETAVNGQL